MDYKIKETRFENLPKGEGFVFMGCGGVLDEWVIGVNSTLRDEKVSTSSKHSANFKRDVLKLVTTEGRTDLVFLFRRGTKVDVSRAATWRLRFGDTSWLSDYMVNYDEQHGR